MLSGQYPHNHGYFGLGGPTPARLPNLFAHARQFGYRTAGIGKLHLPDDPRNWVADDLDLYADCYRSADGDRYQSPYHHYLRKHGVYEIEDSRKIPNANGGYGSFDARPTRMPKEHVVEYWCARTANAFIDECGDTPWCVKVSFPRPHHQLTPLQAFWDLYEGVELPDYYQQSVEGRPAHFQSARNHFSHYNWSFGEDGANDLRSGLARAYRGTLACISMVDDAIGVVLDNLEAKGQLDNTIIVYTTDHGAYHGMFGLAEKYPGICSEEVCRIPMIWSYPNAFCPGTHCHSIIENIDILPTLLQLADVPQLTSTDGKDATGRLAGNPSANDKAFAVTENEWSKAIRWQNYRMVYYPLELFGGEEVGELYDLDADPWETRNLYADPSFKELRDQLQRMLMDWLICSTRHVTSHPPFARDAGGCEVFILAGDGKESNTTGPRHRIREGKINYL